MTSLLDSLDRTAHGATTASRQQSLSASGSDRAAVAGKPVVFVSTMTSAAWGGSEELWAQAASRLRQEGVKVGVSVHAGMATQAMLRRLEAEGAHIHTRSNAPSWLRRIWRHARAPGSSYAERDIMAFLAASDPALVIFSDGNCMVPIRLLEFCQTRRLRFVTIGHMTSEYFGLDDEWAARYRAVMPLAERCYFVSRTNLKVFERQIGCSLPNAEIVLNPFKVDYRANPPWPSHYGAELRLAHVGRLHPPSKGQDILLEALSQPQWCERAWHLTLYGDGSMREVIARLIDALNLSGRVTIKGHVDSVEGIWADNQVLIMPSRYEGLPLAIIEAMLCGRPVLATDVGGHAEVIEDGVTGFIAGCASVRSISAALERLWTRRDDLETIGRKAANAIRAQVPPDPVGLFTNQMTALAFADR